MILNSSLENLLEKEEKSRYMLTIIRTPAKGLSYSDVKAEITKQEIIKPIYISSVEILRELKISKLTIKYFATLTIKFNVYRLRRYDKAKRYLHLLCFVYYRYQKINDDLVKTYFYLLSRYTSKIKQAVDIRILTDRKENTKNLKKAPELLELFIQSGNDNLAFKDIKSTAYSILEKDKLKKLIEYMNRISLNEKKLKWEEWESMCDIVKRNIRPIIRVLDFDNNKESLNEFFYAFEYFQSYVRSKKRRPVYFPQDFIKKVDIQYLYRKGLNKETGEKEQQLVFSRYEIYIYKKLFYYLNSGDIFVNDSFEFRSLEDDLINQTYFLINHKKLIPSLNLKWFSGNLRDKITEKVNMADNLFSKVNNKIIDGEKSDFKFNKSKNTWSLDYETTEHNLTNNNFFKYFPLIDLPDLLSFVNKKTSFYNDFTHILNRNITANKNNELMIIATIIAYGVNMGINKMSKSSNISYEGHHILELLLMNTSEIDPDIHSTDSHGITDIILLTSHFFTYFLNLNHH